MQMNGMSELLTIGKYWRRWSDPRLVVLVRQNRDLDQVTSPDGFEPFAVPRGAGREGA